MYEASHCSFCDSERIFARAMNRIMHANPFDQEEISRLERAALDIELPGKVNEIGGSAPKVLERPDLTLLVLRAEGLAELARRRLVKKMRSDDQDGVLYRDLVLFNLYFRYRFDFQESIEEALRQPEQDSPSGRPSRALGLRVAYYDRFASEVEKFLGPTPWFSDPRFGAEHRFALCFQIRRAFHFINAKIRGRSRAITRLRRGLAVDLHPRHATLR